MPLLPLFLLSFAAKAEEPAVTDPVLEEGLTEEIPAERPDPNASQQALYESLSVRHGPASCEDLSAACEDPVTDLLFVVDHATQPPWAGMRAASCLLQLHAEAASPQITSWLITPELKGLAILTLNQLDEMPLSLADSLARAALAGPHADEARNRIDRTEIPELRALLDDDSTD